MRKKNETKKVQFPTDYPRHRDFLKFSWEEGDDLMALTSPTN